MISVVKNTSLVIPHFNQEVFLEDAIKSAIKAGYIDVVVVDDGSSNKEVVKDIVGKFGKKVRFIQNEKNSGVSVALNIALEETLNSKVRWLSADDVLVEPNDLGNQKDIQSGLTYGNYDLIDEFDTHLTTINVRALTSRWLFHENHDILAFLSGLLNGCAMVINKELIQKEGGFNSRLRTTQDYDMWYRLLKSTSFDYIEQTLVKYRLSISQGSRSNTFIVEGEQFWLNVINEVSEYSFPARNIDNEILFCILYCTLEESKFKEASKLVQKKIFEFFEKLNCKIDVHHFLRGIREVNVFMSINKNQEKSIWSFTFQDFWVLYKLSNKMKKENNLLSNSTTSRLLNKFSKNLTSTLIIKFIFLRVKILQRLKYYALKKIIGLNHFQKKTLHNQVSDNSPIVSGEGFDDFFKQFLSADQVITTLEGEFKLYSLINKKDWLKLVNKLDLISKCAYMRC